MSKTGRGADQYMMRFPDGMRDAVIELSKQSGRSMNSEIIIALEKHLASNGFEVPQPKPTGYNHRLENFVAAALSGLLSRPDAAFDTACSEARMIGGHMLQLMEEEENG